MEIKWEEKVWGRVRHLFHSDYASVSHLEVKAGFQCSRHKHSFRINQFTVLSGEVVIERWLYRNGEAELLPEVRLKAGDSFSVPAGMFHRFRVIESGEMVEVYWPQREGLFVSINDIIRLDEGGPCDT